MVARGLDSARSVGELGDERHRAGPVIATLSITELGIATGQPARNSDVNDDER